MVRKKLTRTKRNDRQNTARKSGKKRTEHIKKTVSAAGTQCRDKKTNAMSGRGAPPRAIICCATEKLRL